MEERSSLRAAVARFQVRSAHASTLKLQHQPERVAHLEAENARLRTELGVLRSSPLPPSAQDTESPDSRRANPLPPTPLRKAHPHRVRPIRTTGTLSLAQANTLAAEKSRSWRGLCARRARAGARGGGAVRIQKLERALREEREKGALSERAVSAYAELVRGMEGRSPASASSSSFTLIGGTDGTGKEDLEDTPAAHLLSAVSASFAASSIALEKCIFALESELQVAEAQLAATRALNGELGTALAGEKFEGEKFEGERARAADKNRCAGQGGALHLRAQYHCMGGHCMCGLRLAR
ncbi:hypothetical protein FB451DRAFT_1561333 [Mycena latifolia]|nr:hypothetical protein FB451DRAFT_1561333 [Mycena latifolia]